jgi:hypothetical protein
MDCIDPRPPAIDREDTAAEDDPDGSEDRQTTIEGSDAGVTLRRRTCSFCVTRLRIISVDRAYGDGNYKLKLEDDPEVQIWRICGRQSGSAQHSGSLSSRP